MGRRTLVALPWEAGAVMRLIESILADAAAITTLRRDIHAHPELCFEEQRTSDLIAKALTDWGIPIHRGMGMDVAAQSGDLRRIGQDGFDDLHGGLRGERPSLPAGLSPVAVPRGKTGRRSRVCGPCAIVSP